FLEFELMNNRINSFMPRLGYSSPFASAVGANIYLWSGCGVEWRVNGSRFSGLCLVVALAAVVCACPAAAQVSAHATSKVTGVSFLDAIPMRDSDIANAPDL